jgi:hypothetical protein
MRYTYRGDRLTDTQHKGRQCDPVRRSDGKCITSKQATMLVIFEDGTMAVVLRRQLRINQGKVS